MQGHADVREPEKQRVVFRLEPSGPEGNFVQFQACHPPAGGNLVRLQVEDTLADLAGGSEPADPTARCVLLCSIVAPAILLLHRPAPRDDHQQPRKAR